MIFKKQKADPNNSSRLFFLLGLVAVLIAINYILELWTPVMTQNYNFETELYELYESPDIPDTNVRNDVNVKVEVISAKTPITTLTPKAVSLSDPIFDNIEIVANETNVKESVIESTESGEKDAIEVEGIKFTEIEEVEIEEEVIEDVPFFIIEKVPVYPGCKGDNDALRLCMQKKIQEYVAKNFNSNLSQDLGLPLGKKKIFVSFIIDRQGGISSVRSRAPHKRLEKEAERVIRSLPKMKPGTQRGRKVRVKYSLPIVFEVRE